MLLEHVQYELTEKKTVFNTMIAISVAIFVHSILDWSFKNLMWSIIQAVFGIMWKFSKITTMVNRRHINWVDFVAKINYFPYRHHQII